MTYFKLQTLTEKARQLSQEEKWGDAAEQWDKAIPLLINSVVDAYHGRSQARYNAGDDEGGQSDDHRARYHRRGLDQSRAEATQAEMFLDTYLDTTQPSPRSLAEPRHHFYSPPSPPPASAEENKEPNKSEGLWAWTKQQLTTIVVGIITILIGMFLGAYFEAKGWLPL